MEGADCCSANITWTLPPNEVEGGVSYTLQVTSSCPTLQGNNIFSGITERVFQLTNLCPAAQYALAIRVTELSTNTTGVYGHAFQFNTTDGVPSIPRGLKPLVTVGSTTNAIELMVLWAVPEALNGKLSQYEIRWSPSPPTIQCSDSNVDMQKTGFVDATITEFKTSDVSNLDFENSKTVLVCVRASTSTTQGAWARFYTSDGTALGFTDANTSTAGTCTNLVVVAVIASLAILSTIVLGCILVLIIGYNGWTPLKDCKDKRDDDKVEDITKNTKPPYKKTFSTQSTSSQAPLTKTYNGRSTSTSS